MPHVAVPPDWIGSVATAVGLPPPSKTSTYGPTIDVMIDAAASPTHVSRPLSSVVTSAPSTLIVAYAAGTSTRGPCALRSVVLYCSVPPPNRRRLTRAIGAPV